MRKAKTTKVTLRFRMLNTGKETLYLDYYPGIPNPKTGETMRREYLGMYVVPLKKGTESYKPTRTVHTSIVKRTRKLYVLPRLSVPIGRTN